METKKCNKCGEEKILNLFRKRKDNKSGYGNNCKVCEAIITKKYRETNKEKISEYRELNKGKNEEYFKKRYKENKEKLSIYFKKNYEKNKNKKLEYDKEYRLKNKDKVKINKKIWYNKNKKRIITKNINNYLNRKNNDPLFKLRIAIKNNIYQAIKKKNFKKKSRTHQILGCSYEDFKIYLESKFNSWMNWDNYGKYNGELNYGWDLDHIIPITKGITEEDIINLNHFTNIQPLCSYVNRVIKRDN